MWAAEQGDRRGNYTGAWRWRKGREIARHTVLGTAAVVLPQVLDLPGVAGLHVMPLTKAARQMTLEFLEDGTLPSKLCSPAPAQGLAARGAEGEGAGPVAAAE